MAPGKNLTANMDESGVGKVLLKLILRVLSGANDMPPFCPIVTDVRALCGCVLCGDRIELVAVDRSGSFGRHPSAGMTSGECGEAQSEPCPLV